MENTDNKVPVTEKKVWYKTLWENIKWFCYEMMLLASSKKSFFSKKRIESGLAFWLFYAGAIYVLITVVKTMTDFLEWSAVVLFVVGYNIRQIQKEKKEIAAGTMKEEGAI